MDQDSASSAEALRRAHVNQLRDFTSAVHGQDAALLSYAKCVEFIESGISTRPLRPATYWGPFEAPWVPNEAAAQLLGLGSSWGTTASAGGIERRRMQERVSRQLDLLRRYLDNGDIVLSEPWLIRRGVAASREFNEDEDLSLVTRALELRRISNAPIELAAGLVRRGGHLYAKSRDWVSQALDSQSGAHSGSYIAVRKALLELHGISSTDCDARAKVAALSDDDVFLLHASVVGVVLGEPQSRAVLMSALMEWRLRQARDHCDASSSHAGAGPALRRRRTPL